MNSDFEKKMLAPEFYNFYYNDDTSIFREMKDGSDIWNFPFFSEYFCDYLINLAESKNAWSKGIFQDEKNQYDERINNIENFPTQDIHLKDLGLHDLWSYIINKYFSKIMSVLYKYKTKNYNIAFIVKYDADNKGQVHLDAHHDSSTYSTNIALNDSSCYEGGGVYFIRKKIIVYNKNKGWLLLHPGAVTHYHQALPITKGKRYILVSFNY